MQQDWPSFDELKYMAERSPEKLEDFRQREIDRLVAQAPPRLRKRLLGLQFQVNCQRQLHKTPMGSCVAISRMMHESLAKLSAALNDLPKPSTPLEANRNNVVPFAG